MRLFTLGNLHDSIIQNICISTVAPETVKETLQMNLITEVIRFIIEISFKKISLRDGETSMRRNVFVSERFTDTNTGEFVPEVISAVHRSPTFLLHTPNFIKWKVGD